MYEEFKKTRNIKDYPTGRKIRNKFRDLVKPGRPWIAELSKEVYANAFEDLQVAFTKYKDYEKAINYKKLHHTKEFIPKVGRPKFKSKIYDKDRYRVVSTDGETLSNNRKTPNLYWKQNRLYIPKFKKKNYLKTSTLCKYPQGHLKRVTISRSGDRYYASCLFEFRTTPKQHNLKKHRHIQLKIGVDVGVKTLATLSDGRAFASVNTKKVQKRINKLQRKKFKQKFGSHNRSKTIIKLDRAYRHKANMLDDNLHQVTNYLVRHYDQINIEDLSSSNMMKNHKLAGSIANQQFYRFKIYLQYKAEYINQKEGRTVDIQLVNPKNTTQRCSMCGFKQTKKLELSDRTLHCENCGFTCDRDWNAAKNIYNLA